MTIATKAPGQTPVVRFEWADRLAVGETITGATWSTVPVDEAITFSDQARSGTTTSAKVSGGPLGKTYEIVCTITKSPSGNDVLSTPIKILTSEAV